MADIYRPHKLNLYEPTNPEHYLIDSFNREYFEIVSPRLLYWKFDMDGSKSNQNSLQNLYQENTTKKVYDEQPLENINLYIEKSPVLEELNKAGIKVVEEVTVVCSIMEMEEKLGRSPIPGDIFRVSHTVTDNKERFVFYEIGSVVPTDLFKWRYTNYTINATQSPLENVPKHIKEFLHKEM